MTMEEVLHRAVQYIAAIGISYAVHEADDGHTTLTWDQDNKALVGQPVPKLNGISFAMSLPHYALECRDAGGAILDTMPLQGTGHDDIMSWIKRMVVAQEGEPDAFRFDFHYELAAHEDRSPFPAPDVDELTRLAELRSAAHKAISEVLTAYSDTEPIRIWPHHFDSGSLITLRRKANGSPLATIGIGLAIPDDILPAHYYYVSPWQAEGNFDMSELPGLTNGRWLTNDWKGAVLEADDMGLDIVERFLNEASAALSAPINA